MERDMSKCLLFYPEILEPLMCSYPNEKECGLQIKVIKTIKGRKEAINICTYRAKEIGMKNCIKEQLRLKLKDSIIERFYDL